MNVIDSDTALALANGALGTAAGEALQLGFGLMWAPSHCGFANPFWRLNYEFAAPRPLNSRQVTVDALESQVLEVK